MKKILLITIFLMTGLCYAQQVIPKITILDTTNTNNKWTYTLEQIRNINLVDSIVSGYISFSNSTICCLVKKQRIVAGDTLIRMEEYVLPISAAQLKVTALYNSNTLKTALKKDVKANSIGKRLE
jgi:hypothetical protein